MQISNVLADVKRRGLIASLRGGAAREALAVVGWEDRRGDIVAAARAAGVPEEDALAAFGLVAGGQLVRLGKVRGNARRFGSVSSMLTATTDREIEEHARRFDAVAARR